MKKFIVKNNSVGLEYLKIILSVQNFIFSKIDENFILNHTLEDLLKMADSY